MTLRPHSEIGFLMLQWLGVLVPGAFREEVRKAAREQGKSVYQRTPNIQPGAQERFMNEQGPVALPGRPLSAVLYETPDSETVTTRARRLVEKLNREGRPIEARCPRCWERIDGGMCAGVCMNCDVDHD